MSLDNILTNSSEIIRRISLKNRDGTGSGDSGGGRPSKVGLLFSLFFQLIKFNCFYYFCVVYI